MKKKRILIANRGEIAIRTARAIREVGHIPVGFYTDDELQAAHLDHCGIWLHLSGSNNSETYLNKEKIIKLAKDNQVDAIHPGYGFLAENYEFAKEVIASGIVWIGPHPEAIKNLGDKATSKQIADKAGVPTVPGSKGEVANADEGLKIAKEIGYPVLLKAVAGGGGKGMRAVYSDEELSDNFAAVQREAQSSFGNPGVLVEKLIENPHHIEVQILADKKGNVFHFYERECSVQRRHQKVVEEAPSPFIGNDEDLRKRVCETAVDLARAVDYDSAGTVEFIMGEDKQFYFLEMNTRIQVEHPITEEITGIDLIVCMIQAAFDEDLEIPNQDFIAKVGHAIECRICAEDPITMLPAPGKVSGMEVTFPQGVRFDHCLYKGLEVTPNFDPMVGKLIVKGINRKVALRKMRAALNGIHIEGLKNNIPLHKAIMEDDKFIAGEYTTGFLYERKPQDKIDRSFDFDAMCEKLAGIEATKLWG